VKKLAGNLRKPSKNQLTHEEEVIRLAEALRYTAEHTWVKQEGKLVRVGLTDYAQQELGDIVFVDLPDVWERFAAKAVIVTIESIKAMSEILAPVSGEIVEINEKLQDSPELVNQDPYRKGWLVVVEPSNPGELKELLKADAYEALISK
jgi:glycine cleavage system H protein